MVSPGGVAPSRIVCVSASVNLPLHHKVQKFSSGTGSPGWSQKKGRKTVVVVVVLQVILTVDDFSLYSNNVSSFRVAHIFFHDRSLVLYHNHTA